MVGDRAYSRSSCFWLFFFFASCLFVASCFFFSSCSWLLFLLSLVKYLVCLWLLVLFLFSVLPVLCLCHLPLSLINNNNFLTTFFCAKLYTLHGILHCMELCQLPFETDIRSGNRFSFMNFHLEHAPSVTISLKCSHVAFYTCVTHPFIQSLLS